MKLYESKQPNLASFFGWHSNPWRRKKGQLPDRLTSPRFTCSSFAGCQPSQRFSGPRLAAFPRERSRAFLGVSGWRSTGAREPLTPLLRVWVKSRQRVWSNLVTEVLEVLTKHNKNKSGKTWFTDTTQRGHRFLGFLLFGSPACRCLSGQ